MIPLQSLVIAVSLLQAPTEFRYAADEAELSPAIGVNELKAHVYRLASPEFLGRRGVGAARASRHIEEMFQKLGLKPAFGDSYLQPIPWLVSRNRGGAAGFIGRNVGGVIEGSDPKLRDEWIILSAHFDHLGQQGTTLYPGADDNASGVAMLLEVAEWMALRAEKPRRTVMFVAFDLEESALMGSTHFAAHPPRDFSKLKAFITADMLGRSMANVMDEYVFALGSETSPRLHELLEEVQPKGGVKVGRLGADIIGTRGDYGAFRDRHVPFLFLSTGQHPDYHKSTDTPERLDYEKLQKISQWIGELAWRLANDNQAPSWQESGRQDLEEVRTILSLVERVEKRPGTATIAGRDRDMLAGFRQRLEGILQRGRITEEERTWLVWSTRLLLITVF
jgi:hypothetical protein